jgi:hypothetical protein
MLFKHLTNLWEAGVPVVWICQDLGTTRTTLLKYMKSNTDFIPRKPVPYDRGDKQLDRLVMLAYERLVSPL